MHEPGFSWVLSAGLLPPRFAVWIRHDRISAFVHSTEPAVVLGMRLRRSKQSVQAENSREQDPDEWNRHHERTQP
jgi:hypothetical protein